MELLEVQKKQKKSLGIIWEAFEYNKAEISKAAGVTAGSVTYWFKVGKVSPKAAIKLESHPKLKGVITKEEMLPNQEWFGV